MPSKHEQPVSICPTTETGLQVERVLPRSARGRHRATEARPGVEPVDHRIPRMTRLMALAIKCQDMVERGEIRDYAELARLGYVTRARITQIMNLLLLAPDLQEALLFMDLTRTHPWSERSIRAVVALSLWGDQRAMFHSMS